MKESLAMTANTVRKDSESEIDPKEDTEVTTDTITMTTETTLTTTTTEKMRTTLKMNTTSGITLLKPMRRRWGSSLVRLWGRKRRLRSIQGH